MLASALRSVSRVQNTNTNCPHNIGLLSDRRGGGEQDGKVGFGATSYCSRVV